MSDNELKQHNQSARNKLMENIVTYLGGELIDVELDTKSLNTAVDLALAKYRQRSENAVEENYIFMELKEHQNDYHLPNEIVEVRQIFRRTFGIASGESSASMIDPFEQAYINMYLQAGTGVDGLATYELYMGNLELAGKMFGVNYYFDWNSTTKRLKIARNIRADKEEVLLWVYSYIPEYLLLKDTYAGIWITKYAIAEAKIILGTVYSKYSSGLAGPQGGVSLNGSELKSEGQQEKDALEQELKTYTDGAKPLGFIMG